ncbi:MAG: hypothetical protein OHK0021_22780 [Bryobacter sp.]
MRAFLLLFPFLALAQPAERFAELDAILTRAQSTLNTPLTLVLTQHGETIYNKSFGGGSATTTTAIGSGSKWLSGAVLLRLVDRGIVGLDDLLALHIPSFGGDKAAITLRHAFSHTSGLPGEIAFNSETPCLNDRMTTLAACADEIAGVSLANPPGTAFAYGGLSMQAAGRAMEIASGLRFVDLFQRELVRPLGLSGTIAALPGAANNPLVAGGFASTATDYTRFLQMLLAGGAWEGQRYLSPRAVQAMLADQTNGARIVSTPYSRYESLVPGIGSTRYGIGNWLERVQGGVEGAAVLESSSQGGFGFSPWIDYDRNLTGVLMVRDSLPNVAPFYFELKRAIARLVPLSPLSPRGIANAASYASGAVAAGEWVVLFGNFAGAGEATRVLVEGFAAPLLYALPGQIAARIPPAVAGRASVDITVEIAPGNRTPPVRMAVESAWPGLFSVALNQDGTLNSPSNPAVAGSVVVLYGTGLGQGPTAATVGGFRAEEILYADAAPGAPEGFFQINLRLPHALPAGQATVIVESGGIPSAANLTLHVRR